MKTVFDSSFRYTRSLETDVRKTFDRVRRQQRRDREQATSQPETKVTVLKPEQFKKGATQLA